VVVDSTGEYNGCFQQALLVQKKKKKRLIERGLGLCGKQAG